MVEGATPQEVAEATLDDGLRRVKALTAEGLSKKDAVRQAAKELGLSKNELYAAALE